MSTPQMSTICFLVYNLFALKENLFIFLSYLEVRIKGKVKAKKTAYNCWVAGVAGDILRLKVKRYLWSDP